MPGGLDSAKCPYRIRNNAMMGVMKMVSDKLGQKNMIAQCNGKYR